MTDTNQMADQLFDSEQTDPDEVEVHVSVSRSELRRLAREAAKYTLMDFASEMDLHAGNANADGVSSGVEWWNHEKSRGYSTAVAELLELAHARAEHIDQND